MKQQILDALKTKFTGVPEQILSRIADKLAKTTTTEDQLATSVEGVTIQTIIESYGDSRATEASQTAVNNYEKKHGIKDGQKAVGGEPNSTIEPTNNGENIPTWAKAIIDSNKALRDEISALKGDKIATVRKQQLSKIIEKLPESFRKPYTRLDVQSMTDEEFTALSAELQTEVDGLDAEIKTKGAVFGRPAAGGATTDNKPADKEVDTVAAAMGL